MSETINQKSIAPAVCEISGEVVPLSLDDNEIKYSIRTKKSVVKPCDYGSLAVTAVKPKPRCVLAYYCLRKADCDIEGFTYNVD